MTLDATAQDVRALLELAALDGEAARLPADVHASRRERLRQQIPGPLLDRYQTLLEIDRLPVVAAITGGNCSGCHVRLPTMVEYKARRSIAIFNCPHCHRMLYAPELLREAAPPQASRQQRRTAKRRAGAAKERTRHP